MKRIPLTGLDTLVQAKHMLSGMALSFGTADSALGGMTGAQREGYMENGRFVADAKPLRSDSLFDLASLTKLLTLLAVLKLMEARVIRMTDTVAFLDRRFAGLKDAALFDVLTYRANIQSIGRIDQAPDAAQAERLVFTCHEAKRDGGDKRYSDMHALVLQYVVEAVTGQSLEAFLRREIFEPLQMFNTFALVPPGRLDDLLDYNGEYHFARDGFYSVQEIPLGQPHDPKARKLLSQGHTLSGHAGLFSTLDDMTRLAQGLLRGKVVRLGTLAQVGKPYSGFAKADGAYQQYMGLICFSRSGIERLSEVPYVMSRHAFALSGYTGNHIAIDLEHGVFDLLLGNRCHHRLSQVFPPSLASRLGLADDGSGQVVLPDGQTLYSSFQYVYLKDSTIHRPIFHLMRDMGLLRRGKDAAIH